MDAVYGSLECQKSGAYHMHAQLFVECYHQFTPLQDLMRLGAEPRLELLRKYSSYTAHVRRTIYSNPKAWQEEEQADVEAQWPEYRESHLMLSRPLYQKDADMEPQDWKVIYLNTDVEALQKHKQHHVHLPDAAGKRQPLHHCRDPKDPTKCKSGFPREAWLTDELLLICPGLAESMDMPFKGKKSMVGLLWGPCNDPNLNGTHPALLAAMRGNSDVQPPYRFPITADLHNSCNQDCDTKVPVWQLVRDAQVNQAAQAGYACDYQNKRLPVAVYEVKEWIKGQRQLYEDLQRSKTGYVMARACKRLITDCYARGASRHSAKGGIYESFERFVKCCLGAPCNKHKTELTNYSKPS